MNQAEFAAFLEKYEDDILARVLLTWRLITQDVLRQIYQEKQRMPQGHQCKLGQILVQRRLLQINNYTKAMQVVRQQAQVLYQRAVAAQQQRNANMGAPQLRAGQNQHPYQNPIQATYTNLTAPQQVNQAQATFTNLRAPETNTATSPKSTSRVKAKRSKMSRSRDRKKVSRDRPSKARKRREKEAEEATTPHYEPSTKTAEENQSSETQLGSNFGSYEIICEVARGGMGIVYKAKQRPLNRIVALKVLLSGGAASEIEIQRFRREAESAGALQHPNIVSIYEIGENDGYHYFTMDFVAGDTLQELIKKKARRKKLLQTMEKVARALDHAHQREVVHRDIKPSNIIVSPEWEPKITDFGLAKKLDANTVLTENGATLGTPFYMAPEQTLGSKDVDHRVDIYAMGVILYEILTNRLPFTAGTLVDLYHKIVEEDPIPPTKLSHKVDKELEIICLKAMEKDPKRRYQKANEFADDMKRYLSGEAITAKGNSLLYKIIKKIKRRKQKIAIIAGIVIILIAISILIFKKNEQPDSQLKLAQAKLLFEEGKEAMKNKNFKAAMDKWERAIYSYSKFKPAYIARGNAYRKRGEYLSAITEYKRVLEIDPKSPEIYYKQGLCYLDLKEWDKAIEQFTQAIKFDPEYVAAYTKRAEAYQKKPGSVYWNRAIDDFEKAAALSKKLSEKKKKK